MKVLHFYKTALPDTVGGVEQIINQLARDASKLGVESHVLSLSSDRVSRTETINGYTSHRERLNFQLASTGFSASAFSRFSQLSKKVDVIHYHFPWPFMDIVHFVTRVNKPTIVTYHSDIIRQKKLLKLYEPIMFRFLSKVDRIVATSPNYLETSYVLKKFSNKVKVIPIGLDKIDYPGPSIDNENYWRKRVGDKFFLFVGVLRYYKGLHILLEAAKNMSYPIVIVGAGPIEQELKVMAIKLNLQNIHFLGFLPESDKTTLMKLCYSVVFPSHLRSEAFGISLLEGAMYGKPMISSEIGTGTTYINIADETGLVVPPSDPVALRQAMIYLWDNPIMAAKMGVNAQARYLKYFTANKMVDSYVDLYREIALK